MTELAVIQTGEIVESMTRVEAERITARIADKLDAIADNLEQVMPMIREALTREAWKALGYASPTAYVSERFAGALGRLPRNVRQPVVCELSAAGMSTRAIAPIVQVHHDTVASDVRSGVGNPTPDPEHRSAREVLRDAEQNGDIVKLTGPNSVADLDANEEAAVEAGATVTKTTVTKITGIDGKRYTKPEPSAPRRRPLRDGFRDASLDLDKLVRRFQNLVADDRFARNKDEVTRYRNDLVRANEALQRLIDQF